MSHLLDELLAQAANGSPVTAALSSEDVAVLLFASEFLGVRENWLDKGVDPLDEVTDADWDAIEKLVGNVYEALMNPLIGQIMPMALATVPPNMLLCDGQGYTRAQYPQLYAVLDAAFIVDADNFIVPDLRGRVPIGSGTGNGLTSREVGDSGGDESVTLTASQNGVHTHLLNDPGHVHRERVGNGASAFVLGTGGGANPTVGSGLTTNTAIMNTEQNGTGITVQNSAGGNPHINMQPFLCLNFAIVAL